MKKIGLVLMICTFITSCSNSDDNDNSALTNNDLIGTWKVTDVTSKNAKVSGDSTQLGYITVSTDVEISGKDYNMTITFADNPKKISNAGSFTLVVKANVPTLGEKSYEQVISEVPATSGDWNVEGDTLTTTNNGEKMSIQIVSSNQSEIVFSYPLSNNLTEDELSDFGLKNVKIEGDLLLTVAK